MPEGVALNIRVDAQEALEMIGQKEGDLRPVIDSIIRDIAENVKDEAVKGAPKDMGKLERSIGIHADPERRRYTVGTDVAYGLATEFGSGRVKVGSPELPRLWWKAKITSNKMTSRMPWLRSALHDVGMEADEIIERRIEKWTED